MLCITGGRSTERWINKEHRCSRLGKKKRNRGYTPPLKAKFAGFRSPTPLDVTGRVWQEPGHRGGRSSRRSSALRALPQAQRPQTRRHRRGVTLSGSLRAPKGKQKRVRCGFYRENPLPAFSKPPGPGPPRAALPQRRARPLPQRRRGEGKGQRQPPIRNCGSPLTDKANYPMGVVA